MYAGLGANKRGMGDIDWGNIISQGITSAGNVVSSIYGQNKTLYPTTQGTVYKNSGSATGGLDLTTIALLGMGMFFVVKMLKR
jgi:hypothetical protein